MPSPSQEWLRGMQPRVKTPLIVVDMQDAFLEHMLHWRDRYVAQVTRQVKRARKQERPIVALRYWNCGPVVRPIREVVANYEFGVTKTKRENNGSKEVIEALRELRVDTKWVSVCGVNMSHCVQETIEGLTKRGFFVRAIGSSIRDTSCALAIPDQRYLKNFSPGAVRLV